MLELFKKLNELPLLHRLLLLPPNLFPVFNFKKIFKIYRYLFLSLQFFNYNLSNYNIARFHLSFWHFKGVVMYQGDGYEGVYETNKNNNILIEMPFEMRAKYWNFKTYFLMSLAKLFFTCINPG